MTGTGTGTGTGPITLTGTGFTRSPFTGTERGTENRVPGGGVFSGPSYVTTTLAALTQYAVQLKAMGALEFMVEE